MKDLGPDEILSYIYNAEIVLSSSFHATSFALIFKKQFYTILPDLHTNERILDLLTARDLQDHIITDPAQLENMDQLTIDYDKLKPYTPLIESSKAYLEKALQ